MFSPAAHATRQSVFRQILRPQDQSVRDENATIELDDTQLDPDALSGMDEVAYYDLKEHEDRYDVLMSTTFDYSSLVFTRNPCSTGSLLAPNADSVLKALEPAHSATQKWIYRYNALSALLNFVQGTQCAHPDLVVQREALVVALNIEMDDLVHSAVRYWTEKAQRDEKAFGLRIIQGTNRIRPYTSPLTVSLIVLVAIAHCLMGVARESCNFLLLSLKAILSLAADMQGTRAQLFAHEHLRTTPSTLATALHFLNLAPALQLFVTCPRCSSLYKEHDHANAPDKCTAQNLDNVVCGEPLFANSYRGGRARRRPIRRYSHQLLETWLAEILQRPGVEDALESIDPSQRPIMTDIWDGTYWKNSPALQTFLDSPNDELRLVMLLYHDFFNPFTNKTAGKIRSIGCFYMVCLNLPPELRYDTSFAYLASIVPGPSEPSAVDLQHFVRPIVDEMLEMFDPGVWVARTHKYPQGRKVRVAVPLNSMDTVAARAFCGFASHGHRYFCYLCSATLDQITVNDLMSFTPRTMLSHRTFGDQWANASNLAAQKAVFDLSGVRNCEWSRFDWWDAFSGTVIGPMHWIRNVLDKQLRRNMNWSWTLPTGIPQLPSLARPISELEYDWGQQALWQLDGPSFERYKLPEPLVRYLCRQRNIFEAGLSTRRLITELNNWRVQYGIINAEGKLIAPVANNRTPVSVAKAHYYLSKAKNPSALRSHASVDDLVYLCQHFRIPSSGLKAELVERLIKHYANVRVQDVPDTMSYSKSKKDVVAVLGTEVLTEVRNDMGQTTLPRWIKHPPKNFGTLTHGKLQSEEYKSLALVSFVITLVRIWGTQCQGPFRERLDHFLHLMLAVRILSFQSLVESDIAAFEYHYGQYLCNLDRLYPHASRIPTHHLGLHIPAFLRSLGPSTRFSESTCEMFIGLLQDISTNFKFGDLEMTMHREFIMASRLKGLIEQQTFINSLGGFGHLAQDFLAEKVPGKHATGWKTNRGKAPTILTRDHSILLSSWASSRSMRTLSSRLYSCSSIQYGNVCYTPYQYASGDSCVLFLHTSVTGPNPGRIDLIVEDEQNSVILILVRPFVPLSSEDLLHDPYWNHPIIGHAGAAIAQLYYDDVSSTTLVIQPRDLVSHIAVCNFDSDKILKPCVVVLSLDLKHKRYS